MHGGHQPRRSLFLELWQHLPWTAVFWTSIVVLLGFATFFGIAVELRDFRLRHTDRVPEIRSGDTVQVVAILDGDQFVVEKDGGRATIRMLGVKAFDPVVNEFEITAFGRAAIVFAEKWLLNQSVRVLLDEGMAPRRDVHGRFLAYFERDGIDLNRLMLEEGLAMVYSEYPYGRESPYFTAERLARKAARGIWGSPRASSRVLALRKDWGAARVQHTGQHAPDPLLEDDL